jgi:ADP-ribose pyrophosphatase
MRQIVYQGRRLRLALEQVPLPDGTSTTKEIIEHPGAVVILPFLDEQRVCLVRNYRYTIGQTLLELPAGTMTPGEPPEETARRELAEETGYRAASWMRLREFYPSPGVIDERMIVFAAHELTVGPTNLDPGEQLEPVVLTWEDVLSKVLDGAIVDGKTILSVLLWDRVRSSQ